jgi:methylmalonyl-CoA/ethylmalonyl-CoA epimerase
MLAEFMAEPTLSRIGQIAVTVESVDRAVEFYRDKVGLTYLFGMPNMAFFDCGGIRLMLSVREKPDESFSSIIYYKVDDIEKTFDTLSGRGVPFEGKPHMIARMNSHDLWMAFFRDPDRNVMALMSEVPRK